MRLSQPSTSTAVIGRSDHCGNWLSMSRRASATSIDVRSKSVTGAVSALGRAVSGSAEGLEVLGHRDHPEQAPVAIDDGDAARVCPQGQLLPSVAGASARTVGP